MKISARNVFKGQVTAVKPGAVNTEVDLALSGNQKIVAVITNESVDHLGVKGGTAAFAIIKAPMVIIAKDIGGMKFSTRNILKGRVKAVEHGAVNSSVTLDLGGGTLLSSIITERSTAELGLKEGDEACAMFKASSVILAVEG